MRSLQGACSIISGAVLLMIAAIATVVIAGAGFVGAAFKWRPILIVVSYSLSLTHSLAHSLTHPLTHSLTHSLIRSPTHSFTHSLTHPLTHSLIHSLTHSFSLFQYVSVLLIIVLIEIIGAIVIYVFRDNLVSTHTHIHSLYLSKSFLLVLRLH